MKRLGCILSMFLFVFSTFASPPDVGFSVDLAQPTRKWEYTTFAGNTPSIPVSIMTNGAAYTGLSSYSCELNYGLNDAASSLKTVSGTISGSIATFVAVSNSFPAKGDFFGEIFFSSGSLKITAGQGVLHVQRSPSSGSYGSLNLMNRICWDVVTNTGTVPWSLLTEPIFLASVAYNITAANTSNWTTAWTLASIASTGKTDLVTYNAHVAAQANTNAGFQALHNAQANTNSGFEGRIVAIEPISALAMTNLVNAYASTGSATFSSHTLTITHGTNTGSSSTGSGFPLTTNANLAGFTMSNGSFVGNGSGLTNITAANTSVVISVAWTSNGVAGSSAIVTNTGSANVASFGFVIPVGSNGISGSNGTNGSPGVDGLAATIAVAWTSNSSPGSAAVVTNKGTANAASFGFILPEGSNGAAATIGIAWTSNSAPGSAASVTNVGSSSAASFGFIIPQGSNGVQGIQGPAGSNGVDGAQGPAGSNGVQGIQGPAGSNGVDGAQGPAGSNGVQGIQGPAGSNGVDGAQGPAGTNGAIGPQGPSGTNGVDGATGPQGPAGTNGVDGAQGPAGTNGTDGATGPQGPQGPAGTNGVDGAQGPAGTNGVDGAVGPQGPAGTNGVDGISTTNQDWNAITNVPSVITNGAALGVTAVQPATLTAHTTNTIPHVSVADRTNWDGKVTLADVAGVGYLTNIIAHNQGYATITNAPWLTNVVGYVATNGSAIGLTNFPASVVLTNAADYLNLVTNTFPLPSGINVSNRVAALEVPYQAYSAVISAVGGTCTVTYASGSLVSITAGTSPTTITFDNTNFPTNGVNRVGVELWAGTNTIAFLTTSITNATAPTISSNAWTDLFFRKAGTNALWKGRQ